MRISDCGLGNHSGEFVNPQSSPDSEVSKQVRATLTNFVRVCQRTSAAVSVSLLKSRLNFGIEV